LKFIRSFISFVRSFRSFVRFVRSFVRFVRSFVSFVRSFVSFVRSFVRTLKPFQTTRVVSVIGARTDRSSQHPSPTRALFGTPVLPGPHADDRGGSYGRGQCVAVAGRRTHLLDAATNFFFSDKDHRRFPGNRIPSCRRYTPPRCAHIIIIILYNNRGLNVVTF